MHIAVERGNLEIIQNLLQYKNIDVNVKTVFFLFSYLISKEIILMEFQFKILIKIKFENIFFIEFEIK